MAATGDPIAYAHIVACEERLARAELAAIGFAHLARWGMAIAALAVLALSDVGGMASLIDEAVNDGGRVLLAAAALAGAAWIGWSNYRRERELIELERRFLCLEIEALRRSVGG